MKKFKKILKIFIATFFTLFVAIVISAVIVDSKIDHKLVAADNKLAAELSAGRLLKLQQNVDMVDIDKTAKLLNPKTTVKTEFDKDTMTLRIYRKLNIDSTTKIMNMQAATWCRDFEKYKFTQVELYWVKSVGLKSSKPVVHQKIGYAKCKHL